VTIICFFSPLYGLSFVLRFLIIYDINRSAGVMVSVLLMRGQAQIRKLAFVAFPISTQH
jgi:hypothetical protein